MKPADFPLRTFDKIRYADTDRQGHVNNAVFATFLETGRVEFLYNTERPILSDQSSFVIASLHLDFLKEIKWPGRTEIGTGILRIGNSSITLYQALFQNEICVAKAKTIIVQVDDLSGNAKPLDEQAKSILTEKLMNEV